MNIKKIFGALLTVIGIIGLVYPLIMFMNTNGTVDVPTLAMYGLIGFLLLISGISLVRSTSYR